VDIVAKIRQNHSVYIIGGGDEGTLELRGPLSSQQTFMPLLLKERLYNECI